jgi:hypothetical protein
MVAQKRSVIIPSAFCTLASELSKPNNKRRRRRRRRRRSSHCGLHVKQEKYVGKKEGFK